MRTPVQRPILMSGEMSRATIDGLKTQTRRNLKIQPYPCTHSDFIYTDWKDDPTKWVPNRKYPSYWFCYSCGNGSDWLKCPYGQIGDILWVRETFSAFKQIGGTYQREKTKYKADPRWDGNDLVKWKPSIHMPKVLARTWLKITNIRIERLADISTGDIKAEGVRIPTNDGGVMFDISSENTAIDFLPEGSINGGAPPPTNEEYFKAFWKELWCRINGRESLEANPWLWVIDFKIIKNPNR